MKIGIITQPLLFNYGGFLQAWALQEKLRQMGHEPITMDYIHPPFSLIHCFLSWAKAIILYLLKGKKAEFMSIRAEHRSPIFQSFVEKNMTLTHTMHSFSPQLITSYQLQALIVGSDQVWRPRYNPLLADMYFRFASGFSIPKIAYAASFGVDYWEYSSQQTQECGQWAKTMDAISVREQSAIALIRANFGLPSVEVLDPTLLHKAEDYKALCADIPQQPSSTLLAYILDPNTEKQKFVTEISNQNDLEVKCHTAESNSTLSVEQWLANYRDAECVVTDSFHGTVFSIIFHKPFYVLPNHGRGASRMQCLLQTFHLQDRIVELGGSTPAIIQHIDWAKVDDTLHILRAESEHFLRQNLRDGHNRR